MNSVVLTGRLTKDPDIRRAQNDDSKVIARYTLAVGRGYKREGEPDADFINCVAFGKGAEFAENFLKKGMKIAVEGRIQTGSYTNRDGDKVYTTDIIVSRHEFCERKGAQNDVPETGDGFVEVPDNLAEDDLPFR